MALSTSSSSSSSSSENGEQEHGDGLGVCRPVIGLPELWLKKFKSLFSSCSYSDEVPLAHCYSARVTERERQREADTEWEAAAAFQRQGAACTGRGSVGAVLDVFFPNGREGMSVIGSVMRRGTERHQISDPDSWE